MDQFKAKEVAFLYTGACGRRCYQWVSKGLRHCWSQLHVWILKCWGQGLCPLTHLQHLSWVPQKYRGWLGGMDRTCCFSIHSLHMCHSSAKGLWEQCASLGSRSGNRHEGARLSKSLKWIKDKVLRERYLARYLQVPIPLQLQFPQMGDLHLFLMVYNQSLQRCFTLFNLLPMNSVLCRLLCLEFEWLNSKTFMLLVLWVSFKTVYLVSYFLYIFFLWIVVIVIFQVHTWFWKNVC